MYVGVGVGDQHTKPPPQEIINFFCRHSMRYDAMYTVPTSFWSATTISVRYRYHFTFHDRICLKGEKGQKPIYSFLIFSIYEGIFSHLSLAGIKVSLNIYEGMTHFFSFFVLRLRLRCGSARCFHPVPFSAVWEPEPEPSSCVLRYIIDIF